MPEYGFPLTCIFPYKYRIEDSVLIRENVSQRKPLSWRVLRSYDFRDLRKTAHKSLFLKILTDKKFPQNLSLLCAVVDFNYLSNSQLFHFFLKRTHK